MFKQWLLNEEVQQDEQAEEDIAAFLFYYVQEAVKLYFQDNRQRTLPEYLQTIWPGAVGQVQAGDGQFHLPPQIGRKPLPPHFVSQNLSLHLSPTQQGSYATFGDGVMTVNYDPDRLSRADDYRDMQNILQQIQYQLYHEATHIATGKPGEDVKVKDAPWWEKHQKGTREYTQAQLHYYTDPGEVKAHARQYAIMYMNKYPGEGYDPQKLLQMAQELKDYKMMRYASVLGDPHQQGQFPELAGRMQEGAKAFNDYLSRFIQPGGYRQYRPNY